MADSTKLNSEENQVVEFLLAGYTHNRIATELGSSYYRISTMLETPKLQAEIQRRVASRLQAGAALAVGVVESVLLNEKATPKVRLDAAVKVLEMAGYSLKNAQGGKAASVSDLSNEQLHALAEQLTNEKGNRAKTIDVDATKPASDCDTDIFSA